MTHLVMAKLLVALPFACSAERMDVHVGGKQQTQDLIRHAFTPDPFEPLLTRASITLFDVEPTVRPTSVTKGSSMTSESAQDTARNIQAQLGISGSYGMFSAAAEASTDLLNRDNVKKFRLDRFVEAKKREIVLDEVYPYKRLLPDIKQFLLNESPGKIVERIGQFYAKDVTLGGMLQITNLVEMRSGESKESLEAKVSASYGFGNTISASAESQVNQSSLEKSRKAYSKWRVMGGNSAIWLGVKANNENFEEIKQKWSESVSDDTLAAIGMTLKPIWNLLDNDEMNATKARELKTYMENKWKEEESHTTVKDPLPPAYRWQAIKRYERIPERAVQAGSTKLDGVNYVARNDKDLGKINTQDGAMWNFWEAGKGSEPDPRNPYPGRWSEGEILISEVPVEWQPMRRWDPLPSGALKIGGYPDQGDLYVGRRDGEAGKINIKIDRGGKYFYNFWGQRTRRETSAEILVIADA